METKIGVIHFEDGGKDHESREAGDLQKTQETLFPEESRRNLTILPLDFSLVILTSDSDF